MEGLGTSSAVPRTVERSGSSHVEGHMRKCFYLLVLQRSLLNVS